ncbi:hypothetical protein BgiBS90_021399 [Biomphalaria glabrata]|nr:hypothetical protein BgiBS90_021399 [Biomphalaria glabrata]
MPLLDPNPSPDLQLIPSPELQVIPSQDLQLLPSPELQVIPSQDLQQPSRRPTEGSSEQQWTGLNLDARRGTRLRNQQLQEQATAPYFPVKQFV